MPSAEGARIEAPKALSIEAPKAQRIEAPRIEAPSTGGEV